MTRRSALIFAVLVTAALVAITVNLYTLRQQVQPKQPIDVHTVEELKTAWPEGYQMFQLGAITSDEFVREAWTRVEDKP